RNFYDFHSLPLEHERLLMTLALFSLPLTVILSGAAARNLVNPRLEQRLTQLLDIGVERVLVHRLDLSKPSVSPFPAISDAELRTLSQSASHVVHC
ncbi:MAG: hypothetical protein CVV10_05095, partial [Gammaproteobacteria bacterium HGW-Gammaproteobacteria-14]